MVNPDRDAVIKYVLASGEYEAAVLYALRLVGLVGAGLTRSSVADALATGPDGGMTAAMTYYEELEDDVAERVASRAVDVLHDAVQEAAETAVWLRDAVGLGDDVCEPGPVVGRAVVGAIAVWMRFARIYPPDPSALLNPTIATEESDDA